ncbi:hypothetical protein PR003_g27644 [Phytophthora rubi]|uniref:Uncharacterized protein n=1 Tax=Phytophthora rubi TaxID=129364 RepID=A0A6A3I0X5_9STRA|nr:hypothetical protein PR001_g26243 [Phytophthora rubi]KAE9281568.1 hypothetical protein PR003_g27644 [Phytophthora rubi]
MTVRHESTFLPDEENRFRSSTCTHPTSTSFPTGCALSLAERTFKNLLSDLVGAVESTCIIHPVWECALEGTLSVEDPIAKQPKVTWGAIFGCPDDPWEYSSKFRDAMLKLEAMDEESGEEEGEGDSYGGEIDSSLNWYLQHEAVPMNGIQETKSYSASKSTREELSRKLGELFGLDVPPMVHVCAVQESAPVVKYWRQLDTDVVLLDAIEIYPTFVGSGVPELTAALARTRTVTLQLSLRDEQIPQPKQGLSIVNAGFMLSSVFCGRSICKPYNPHSNIATTQQVEGVTDLELRLSLEQGTPFGGICSALAESTSITELAVRLGVEDDELGLSHWAWENLFICCSPTDLPVAGKRADNLLLDPDYLLPLTDGQRGLRETVCNRSVAEVCNGRRVGRSRCPDKEL